MDHSLNEQMLQSTAFVEYRELFQKLHFGLYSNYIENINTCYKA